MQVAHTRSFLGAPFTIAFTACRFTFQRRRVMLCACEMLLPKRGPLPQMSQICAMVLTPVSSVFFAAPERLLERFLRRAISACRIFSISALRGMPNAHALRVLV